MYDILVHAANHVVVVRIYDRLVHAANHVFVVRMYDRLVHAANHVFLSLFVCMIDSSMLPIMSSCRCSYV